MNTDVTLKLLNVSGVQKLDYILII